MSDWQQLINDLEAGTRRAANKVDGKWVADPEVKKGILDVFRAGNLTNFGGAYESFVDKHNLPARSFTPEDGVRLVPGGSSVRAGAYLAKGVVIMPPAYVNIGAYVDEGTMIDSNALVGSCAQIGKHVHLSAGVQIGGVLEPIGMTPVIIEDEAFIAAGCTVVEGIQIGRRAVLAPGVSLSQATRVYDMVNEVQLERGARIPDGAIVVPGSRPVNNEWGKSLGIQQYAPLIVKYRDEKSEASLALEDALR